MNRALRTSAPLLVACGLWAGGCDRLPVKGPNPNMAEFVDIAPGSLTSVVAGYAWDPEAYAINMAHCGPSYCTLAPAIAENQPLYTNTALTSASVALFDTATGELFSSVAPATGEKGLWRIDRVPSRRNAYFYTETAGGTLTAVEPPPGVPLPTIPPAGAYLPTRTLQAIETHNSSCQFREAAAISDSGVLEAVALHLSAGGTTVGVNDFLDPTKYAGAMVFWMYKPDVPNVKIPAGGTRLETTRGQVFHLDWAEPGAGPAGAQSARGFFVTDGEASPLGIAVALVPAENAPRVITFHAKDTVTNVNVFRPWNSLPQDVELVPGQIGSYSLHLLYPDSAGLGPSFRSAPFFCLPK